jgi:hypothetical protein
VRAWEKSAEAVVARKRLTGRGAKGRRTTQQTIPTTFVGVRAVSRNGRTLQLRQLSGPVVERSAGGFRQEATRREASAATSGRGSKKVLNEDLMENVPSDLAAA